MSGVLAGRVALVSGATSGIGAAAALALSSAGATVVVSGRDVDRGASIVEQIEARGATAMFVAADVRSSADVDAMVEAVVDRFGQLDVAFNSAGIFDRGQAFDSYPDASWDDMLSVNLTGVFRCMRAEIAAMLDTSESASFGRSIVNNASTVASRGSDRASPAYIAAKHGVLGLTRQAALEYVGRGIRVNAVSPGPTATAMAQPLIDEGPAAVSAALAPLNPTGAFITPEQLASAVVYLASDAAEMINGHDLVIDGGQLAKL
jgi:NAD(P)-dependent dehydrogenase (short-subunit alcohol dehydrogenase family)